jgi:mono/diheme cytochrome c family protein
MVRYYLGIVSLVAVLICVGCQGETSPPPAAGPAPAAPADYARGESLFNARCAGCHGQGATGTDRGPPFLDKIYEPNHHADATFLLAVRNGVRAHHWPFGNMPPVDGLGDSDVMEIVGYVRWLQRNAGIF